MSFVNHVVYYLVVPVELYVDPAILLAPGANICVLQRADLVVCEFPMRLFHDMILVKQCNQADRVGAGTVNVFIVALFSHASFHLCDFEAATEEFIRGIKKRRFLFRRNDDGCDCYQASAENKFYDVHMGSIDMACFTYILQRTTNC